jgi:hypothetical protein
MRRIRPALGVATAWRGSIRACPTPSGCCPSVPRCDRGSGLLTGSSQRRSSPSHRIKPSASVRAMAGKAPRHRWHLWHPWQCSFCNLQNLKEVGEFESHSLRQILSFVFNSLQGRVAVRVQCGSKLILVSVEITQESLRNFSIFYREWVSLSQPTLGRSQLSLRSSS